LLRAPNVPIVPPTTPSKQGGNAIVIGTLRPGQYGIELSQLRGHRILAGRADSPAVVIYCRCESGGHDRTARRPRGRDKAALTWQKLIFEGAGYW